MQNCGGMHNNRNQWQYNFNCRNVSVLFIHSGRIPMTHPKKKRERERKKEKSVCTPKNNVEDKGQKKKVGENERGGS
jgi:hypothetical protein